MRAPWGLLMALFDTRRNRPPKTVPDELAKDNMKRRLLDQQRRLDALKAEVVVIRREVEQCEETDQ